MSDTDLASLITEANSVVREAEATFGKLTVAQLNWKPSTERWSIAQCFDHLLATNKAYFPVFDAILSGKKKVAVWERVPILPRIWAKLLIKSLDPTSTRKLKAPKNIEPSKSDIRGEIIGEFVQQQDRIIQQMKASEDLDPERVVVTSPMARLITYSLMDAYRIIVVHEKRHVLQAKRVAEENGFPSKY